MIKKKPPWKTLPFEKPPKGMRFCWGDQAKTKKIHKDIRGVFLATHKGDFVAEHKGTIVGCVEFDHDKGVTSMGRIRVSEDLKHNGVGRALIVNAITKKFQKNPNLREIPFISAYPFLEFGERPFDIEKSKDLDFWYEDSIGARKLNKNDPHGSTYTHKFVRDEFLKKHKKYLNWLGRQKRKVGD